MDNDVISPIQKVLPGALSKWILISSTLLSGFLLTWPSYDLPAKYLTDIDIIKLLLRLLSAGMPLLVGSISLVAILIYYNLKLNTSLAVSNEKIDHLQKRNAELIKHADTFESIASTFQSVAKQAISISEKAISEYKNTVDDVQKKLTKLTNT